MSFAGDAAYAQLIAVLEKSDQPDTQTQKDVADFITHFESSQRYSALYFLEAALTAPSLHVRQMAALCLKRAINVRWADMEPDVKSHLKNGLVRGIQIDDSDVRTVFGSAFVALFAVEGFENWSEAPALLLKLASESPNRIVRDTAAGTLLMLIEDMTANENMRENAYYDAAGNERLTVFVTKELLPRVLELGTKMPEALVFTCRLLYTLMDHRNLSTPLFEEYFSTFWGLLGSVAHSRDPSVRKCVIKGMIETWDRQPMTILDSSTAVFSFLTECSEDVSDNTVQIEALGFWAHILKNRAEEPVRTHLHNALRAVLPRLIPVLIEHTKYTSWDYMSMDESHLEEDNASVPDRVEDVPPRPEGEMGADEDEESATWGTNWTTRKGAALALDYIAQVFGQDQEILQFMLDLIEKRLANETDWEVRESAVLVLGAIARGSAYAMAPLLPKVVQYLIDLTQHPKPLMRSIACWTLSRFADWLCQPEADDSEQPWLQPVMNAILSRVLDRNKRVQEAACSALASFIEGGGCQLVPYIQPIVQTVVKAFDCYQARNLMMLYDAVSTLAQVFGEALPQSPCGTYLLQPIIQRMGTTETHSPQFLALMDCVNSLVQCWELMYAPHAEVTVRRAMTAVFEILNDGKNFELSDGATEVPRWDVIGCSAEVISTVVAALQEQAATLMQQSFVTLEPSVAKTFGLDRQQVGIVDMITLCCQCQAPSVLQSIFALVGDLAWHCSALVATDAIIAYLSVHMLSPSRLVCNNVCWALGVLTETPLGKQRLEPHFHETFMKMAELVNRENEHILMQNLCVAMGKFANTFPQLTAPLIPHFIKPWLDFVSQTRNDREKAVALSGVVNASCLSTDASAGDVQLALARVTMDFPPCCPELEASLRALAHRLSQNPEKWQVLGEAGQQRLLERASAGQ
ncbi:HEAT repeat-containing protein [Babesia ovata]|uniref:HEAT repeat-containing protein n=1 Tax=Babesia ovata TaxID=189622 RepID=A0A2H6KEZ9_9APIC|nr:HEAT repeat-containing protein [Babesia ovata]GBE61557.1 HEAT repeat-containing protein [Babesia ovata]